MGSRATRYVAGSVIALAVSGHMAIGQAAKNNAAKSILTETQLQVETSLVAGRTLSTFTVHVEPTAGDANATGVVTVLEGKQPIGSAVLDDNGNATLKVDDLLPGTHVVHAVFAGNEALAASHSPETQVTAAATGVADFSVSPAQTTLSVVQGNAVTTILTLSPLNGFSGYVTLSCSSLPPYTSCGFVPVNVFVGGGVNSPSTFSITTQAPTGPTVVSSADHSTLIYAVLFPGLLGLAGLGFRGRRSLQQAGLVLIVFASMGTMSGCSQRYGYLKHQPAPLTGTPVGTTNFILEEQSISGTTVIQHQSTLTLTVTAAPAS
jgi:hypothetical protein